MDDSLFDLRLKMNEASNPPVVGALYIVCIEIFFFKHCALFHGVTMKLKVKIAITRPFMAASGSNSKRNTTVPVVIFFRCVS